MRRTVMAHAKVEHVSFCFVRREAEYAGVECQLAAFDAAEWSPKEIRVCRTSRRGRPVAQRDDHWAIRGVRHRNVTVKNPSSVSIAGEAGDTAIAKCN